MSKTKRNLALAIVTVSPCLSVPLSGNASKTGVMYLRVKSMNHGLATWWDSSRTPGDYTIVSVTVADDGKIYQPEITVSSKDIQYDAECLEALCSLSPLTQEASNTTTRLLHRDIIFGQANNADSFNKPSYDGRDIKEYLKSQPQPADAEKAFVVVHKIPVSVLERYPGFFTKEEILNPDNLMQIKADMPDHSPNYIQRVGNLYAYWTELFKGKDITKDQILHRAQFVAQAAL